MNKISLHSGIEIFLDEDSGTFHCKIADREYKETNLRILRERIDEQLNVLNPINMKCIFYDGWSSSGIKEIEIVRKTDYNAFDINGNSFDLKYLYEFSDDNKELVKQADKKNKKGWATLRESEKIAKSMKKIDFDALEKEGEHGN